MPYTSDAERERARWMTLAEAIAYVMKHDDCDHGSATEQLCNAICDGKILSKWEDRKWFDWQSEHARFWARIRISDAKVADPGTGEWRTLLVLKDDVFRIWPDPYVASAVSESGQEIGHGSNVDPSAKAEVGAHSAKNEIEQTPTENDDADPSATAKVGPHSAENGVSATSAASATENDNADPNATAKGPGGRPSAREEIHRALDRLSQPPQADGHEQRPQAVANRYHHAENMRRMSRRRLANLVASECGKHVGDKGWSLSAVLKHIRSWPNTDEPEPENEGDKK